MHGCMHLGPVRVVQEMDAFRGSPSHLLVVGEVRLKPLLGLHEDTIQYRQQTISQF